MDFYRYRRNYWSCSNFASWLLSLVEVEKPGAETFEGWKLWKKETITKHPIIYKLVEDWLDDLQDIVMFPYDVYDNIRIYLRNRFITRTHLIDTRLKPGQWHETDERLLHGVFELLVDFIEIEKAHMNNWCKPEVEKPWYLKWRFLRWGEGRSREDGLAYLDWEMQLTDDGAHYSRQALAAQTQQELYIWWKDIRPTRPDAYEVTGWREFNDAHSLSDCMFDPMNEDERKQMHKLSMDVNDLEESWHQEDEDMLKKLIEIRRTLWT